MLDQGLGPGGAHRAEAVILVRVLRAVVLTPAWVPWDPRELIRDQVRELLVDRGIGEAEGEAVRLRICDAVCVEKHGCVGSGPIRDLAGHRQGLKAAVTLQERDEALLDLCDELGFTGGAGLRLVVRLERPHVASLDEDAALGRWRWHEGSFRLRTDPTRREPTRLYEVGDVRSHFRGGGWERLRLPCQHDGRSAPHLPAAPSFRHREKFCHNGAWPSPTNRGGAAAKGRRPEGTAIAFMAPPWFPRSYLFAGKKSWGPGSLPFGGSNGLDCLLPRPPFTPLDRKSRKKGRPAPTSGRRDGLRLAPRHGLAARPLVSLTDPQYFLPTARP
jgi:hypothetical protein